MIGGIVAGLNHVVYRMDNGYDKNGNKINDNDGDKQIICMMKMEKLLLLQMLKLLFFKEVEYIRNLKAMALDIIHLEQVEHCKN